MAKLKDPNYRIKRYVVKFIGKNGLFEEYHRTTFFKEKGLPFCNDPKNLRETIKDSLKTSLLEKDWKRKRILEIVTNKGTFIYKSF